MMKLFWNYTVAMVVLPYEYTKNTELCIWKGCILWYESIPQLKQNNTRSEHSVYSLLLGYYCMEALSFSTDSRGK